MFHETIKHVHAVAQEYCKVCLNDDKKLYTCGNCKQTSYCGKQCQTQDWKTHNCLIGDFLDELPKGVYEVLIQYLNRADVQNFRLVFKQLTNKLGYAWISAVSWSLKFTMDDLKHLPEKSRGYFRKITIAEVEELVPAGTLDPDHIHVPGIYVHRIFQGNNYEKRIEQRTTRK